MTESSAIGSRVSRVLAQVLDLREPEVGPGLSATTSAAWTSLNHLMLISQLENEFGVVFSNQEVRELTSFDAIIDALGRRLPNA
jgi:acyl carrier protein